MGASLDLSVVIPTFDTAAMTLRCCRAVAAALSPGSEVIVVDDASSDGTAELLRREAPDVTVLQREQRGGFGAAANSGVAAARGEIVLLLNSDTEVSAGALRSLLEAFRGEPGLGIAGARLVNADGTPQWSGGRFPTLAWLVVLVSGVAKFLPRRRGNGTGVVDWVSGAAMACRRAVWTDSGPFRETYRFYAQDVELCARARDAGWGVRIVEEAVVTHHGGATIRAACNLGDLPHDPALLWLDLLTFGRVRYGRTWYAFAVPVLICAALLRIAARRLRELLLRRERLRSSRSATSRYVAALQQLLVERKQVARDPVGRVATENELPSRGADGPRA